METYKRRRQPSAVAGPDPPRSRYAQVETYPAGRRRVSSAGPQERALEPYFRSALRSGSGLETIGLKSLQYGSRDIDIKILELLWNWRGESAVVLRIHQSNFIAIGELYQSPSCDMFTWRSEEWFQHEYREGNNAVTRNILNYRQITITGANNLLMCDSTITAIIPQTSDLSGPSHIYLDILKMMNFCYLTHCDISLTKSTRNWYFHTCNILPRQGKWRPRHSSTMKSLYHNCFPPCELQVNRESKL